LNKAYLDGTLLVALSRVLFTHNTYTVTQIGENATHNTQRKNPMFRMILTGLGTGTQNALAKPALSNNIDAHTDSRAPTMDLVLGMRNFAGASYSPRESCRVVNISVASPTVTRC